MFLVLGFLGLSWSIIMVIYRKKIAKGKKDIHLGIGNESFWEKHTLITSPLNILIFLFVFLIGIASVLPSNNNFARIIFRPVFKFLLEGMSVFYR